MHNDQERVYRIAGGVIADCGGRMLSAGAHLYDDL
jgi:hypothetical protein